MIAYFSCTGNSRLVARLIAERLGERTTDIQAIFRAESPSVSLADSERLIVVFPIHSWGMPKGFADFLSRLDIGGRPGYCCMVATCGDDCGLATRQWRSVMKSKGIDTDAAFSVQMPNTYVIFPGFDVDKQDIERSKLEAAPLAVDKICRQIADGEKGDFTHHGSAAWIKSRIIYPSFMRHVGDSQFAATTACVGCGRCATVCPTANISMESHRPQWHGDCLNCLACYHVCPRHSISFGRRTRGKGQYFCSDDKMPHK